MKSSIAALSMLLLAAPVASYGSDQLIPAGSTVTCRVAEGKISSKTTAIGDPVLCTLNPVEMYGRAVFPYGSYLEGRFEDYKDPGHFVGKGWMELKFDRMYIGNRVCRSRRRWCRCRSIAWTRMGGSWAGDMRPRMW